MTHAEVMALGTLPAKVMIGGFLVCIAIVLLLGRRRRAKALAEWEERRRHSFNGVSAQEADSVLTRSMTTSPFNANAALDEGDGSRRFADAPPMSEIHWIDQSHAVAPWSHAGAIGPAGPDNDWGMSAGLGYDGHSNH